jgi:hypothetical protein
VLQHVNSAFQLSQILPRVGVRPQRLEEELPADWAFATLTA